MQKNIGPNFPAINASIQQAIAPQQPAPQDPHMARYLMYAAQLADAMNSGGAFAHNGEHETNPMMAPFSHGGAPTMAVGFGLGDLLHHYLLRHVSQGTRNTADAIQALSNVAGIMQTNGNRGGFVPRVPPPTLTPVSGPPGAPPPPPLPPGQKP